MLYARRLVAQRGLYGVDKNEMAVDLSKLSLWLVTLAKDHTFTFLDHALRHGDSLVGLTRRQIIGFHWEPRKQKQFGEDLIQKRLDRATEARAKILNAREDVPYRDQEQRLAVADEALNVVRLTGDACVSAFFAGSKKKQREDRCEELFASVSDWYASRHDISKRAPLAAAAASLRSGEHPIPPFHWEIEFPEVFSRENGGFDGFVGNPPFLGGTSISTANGKPYLNWITSYFHDTGDRMDVVAYFFRRAFDLIRHGGTSGLIATNTISQGDTRKGGLRVICNNQGVVYNARRRLRWPGQAAVVVAVVHVSKGDPRCAFVLDGRPVDRITAFLFHRGGNEDPQPLSVNQNLAFNGVYILGMGFTFDDSKPTATPIAEMDRIFKENPAARERVTPYLGGEEVNDNPTHSHSRFVINLSGLSEEEARERYPALMGILEEKVKPERLQKAADVAAFPWWRFWRERGEMQAAIANLRRFLVCARHQPNWGLAFLPAGVTPSDALVIFAIEDFSAFAQLQSRIHEVWARLLGSSIKDDLRYTPSDCFDTFPFANSDEKTQVSQSGEAYYAGRIEVMQQNNEGLTKAYNRFHDPHEQSSEILHLRELHAAMDRAVLEAYGWDDLAATARCEFLLDYEEEDDDEPGARKSKKKKPWRLRWPDDFRDEVLARLLELNQQRHKEELLAGGAESSAKAEEGSSKRSPKNTKTGHGAPLFDARE